MRQIQMLLILFIFVVLSCKHKQEHSGPRYSTTPGNENIHVYSFAVHPLYNPDKLTKVYSPLINYLNLHVKGARFTIEASRDYKSYEEKYRNRKPDFLLPNPWQTLQAIKKGYHVLAMAGDPLDFKGLFIVRKDGNIQVPFDLKGKAVSYPAPTALAACIMPQYFLHRSGIKVVIDIDNRYVGSQESSIMNVYLGQTSAGVTWPPPWRAFQKNHPREASELKVIWETESLVNNSVMVRDNVPEDIGWQVQKLLVKLHATEQGKTILSGMETSVFLTASDKDYDIVRTYVDRFEKEVRKIEKK